MTQFHSFPISSSDSDIKTYRYSDHPLHLNLYQLVYPADIGLSA